MCVAQWYAFELYRSGEHNDIDGIVVIVRKNYWRRDPH